MSSHEQNLPQNPPNHLDFTPAIHHTFMADAGQVVEKACADRGYFDNGRTLGQDGPNDPRIHVNDAQEFWDKWIRQETHSDHPKIRGYWILRDWDRTAQTAVVIARYKSLQICVRAQPGAQGIIFSSADLSDVLQFLVEGVLFDEDEELPLAVHSVCNYQTFQWLILRNPNYVEQGQTSSSMGLTASTNGQAHEPRQVEMIQETLVVTPAVAANLDEFDDWPEVERWKGNEARSSRLRFDSARRRIQELLASPMAFGAGMEDV